MDEELDPGDRIQVADHLASCADCRGVLSELRGAADLFRDSLVVHDEDVQILAGRPGAAQARTTRRLPRWAGRAAAVTLLLGGAAAAAIVPGSPLRGLFVGSDTDEIGQPTEVVATAVTETLGASISVRPSAGELRVRVREFPAGTRIRIMLIERPVGVASLPHGDADARFVVAAGLLEVVGPGSDGPAVPGDGVVLQLPRRMSYGVVEVDGDIAARVSGGRIEAQRRVSDSGDGVVIEVGG
jgi:hypothetical protein